MPYAPDLDSVAARLRAAGCVFAEEEARLLAGAATSADDLDALVERRAAGEPVEHTVGWAEFCGLRIAVSPGVFVPRRRTEFLAGRAIARARACPGSPVVLDLCCGSAPIAAAVAAAMPGTEVHAADVEPAAVDCARRNLGGAGRVHTGDLYAPLPGDLRGRIDVLVANVPYVPTGDIPLLPAEARVHEPHVSLDGGADGLDVLRRVAAAAPSWLAPGGTLLWETGSHQVPAAVRAAIRAGLVPRVVHGAELDATVIIATAA